jgi:hypothetical protein
MNLRTNVFASLFSLLSATVLVQTVAFAEEAAPITALTTNAFEVPDTRYGLFDGLDSRSWYSQGDYPEPFLVDDSGLEINEARLDWLYTRSGDQHNDTVTAEVEKGFGLLTLEIEVPYQRDWNAGRISQGVGNIDIGARYPFYQYVSSTGFFDTTFGGAMEIGIPASSAISVNPEFVPKIFNDTRIGEHFTAQSIFGWSTLTGGGADGGVQNFESGFTFGYSIQHHELPLPDVKQLIPMFELVGDTPVTQQNSGRTSLLGNACFRLNLKTIGRVQPRIGFGYVFPINNAARTDVHCGIVTSLVFEY